MMHGKCAQKNWHRKTGTEKDLVIFLKMKFP